MLKSIRKRRRDRTRNRLANQKRLDAIASAQINESMWSSADTWGGTVCPDCNKSLPTRAFIAGYHTSERFCHADKSRCHHESAIEDTTKWKLANDYVPNKKELKKLEKQRQHWLKNYEAKYGTDNDDK